MGPEVVGPIGFFVTVIVLALGIPLVRAKSREMQGGAGSKVPSEVADRLERMEQAIDAIAVEVERISEGQRFVTRLLAERQGEPPGLQAGDGPRTLSGAPRAAE